LGIGILQAIPSNFSTAAIFRRFIGQTLADCQLGVLCLTSWNLNHANNNARPCPHRPRRLYLKCYSSREVRLHSHHLQARPSYAPSLSQPARFTIELTATSVPLCIQHPDQ
jgi:hypothetical protein